MKKLYHTLVHSAFLVCLSIIFLNRSFVYAASPQGKTFTSSKVNIVTMVSGEQFLWAGTNDQGLLRIDKLSNETKFFSSTNSDLAHDDIRALAFDTLGNLVVGTSRGDVQRCLENGAVWESLPETGGAIMLNGLAVDNQGTIWTSSRGSIMRLKEENWESVINRLGGSITTDLAGDVWIFNRPSGSSENDGAWVGQYVNGGLHSMIPLTSLEFENIYSPYFVVSTKNCWAAYNETLLKISTDQIIKYNVKKDSLGIKNIDALAVDMNDILMTAVKNHSGSCDIFLYDQINSAGEPFDTIIHSIPGNISITASCTDRTDGFWLALSDGKIIKVSKSNDPVIINLGNSQLPDNTISDLVFDTTGNLWAASDKGIVKFDGTEWSVYSGNKDSLPGNFPSALALDSSGTVWAGFSQPIYSSRIQCGLAFFNGQYWRTLTRGHITCKEIAAGKNEDIWTVTREGVFRHDGVSEEKVFETVPSSDITTALGTTVNTIALDSSDIPRIGTGLGIKKYENGIWIEDSVFKHHFTENPDYNVPGVNVNTIVFDHAGSAWIGTDAGLLIDSAETLKHIDTANGILPNNSVQCIATTISNGVWIGTQRGLVHFKGTDSTVYTSSNSVLIDNNITAIAVASNGDIWVGTRTGGLTVLPHSSEFQNDPSFTYKPKSNTRFSHLSWNITGSSQYRIFISTGQPCEIALSLISLDGKLIRHFQSHSSSSSSASFIWNGTDRFNKKVPRGVYLGVIKENKKRIGSFTMLRY